MLVVAGVGQMESRRFDVYNVACGVGWATSMTWAGYARGLAVSRIGDHIRVVVAFAVGLSLIPIFVEILKEPRRRWA